MGQNYANFRAITEDLLAHQALRIATEDNLAEVLAGLLKDRGEAAGMGERARRVFASQAGATDRSVTALKALLAKSNAEKPA
jgi:3-deoxy-D-manno-octulosonic-acid transferase